MKIKMIEAVNARFELYEGDELDVPERIAAMLMRRGRAEQIKKSTSGGKQHEVKEAWLTESDDSEKSN